MKIISKQHYLALAAAGQLGNTLRMWPTVAAALEATPAAVWLTVRSTTAAKGTFISCVHRNHLPRDTKGLQDVYYQEVPDPDSKRIANIEAWLTPGADMWLYLEPNTVLPVRGIRERLQPVCGAHARVRLHATIGEEGYQDLYDLWDKYPTATIEASCFNRVCGTLQRNLVIWEVRDF